MAQYNEQIAGKLMSDLMRDFSLTREQAAGIVGNLIHESRGFKNLQEIAPIVAGSRGGYGYAQWTGPRRRELEAFARDKDWNISSYQANYGNLKRELEEDYAYVIDRIKAADTSKESAKIFERDFERPGIPHSRARAKHALHVYHNTETGFPAPFPTARGVGRQSDLFQRQNYDPFSGNMGIEPRQDTPWADQFAPGGDSLLGAPRTAQEVPPKFFGPPAPRSDYPAGPTNPSPWTDQFAPAPTYAPRTASTERFDEAFTRSIPMGLRSVPMTPGVSDSARRAAYGGLADTMLQAGVGGLDGRLAEQSKSGYEDYGQPRLKFGFSRAREGAGEMELFNGMRSRSQTAVPVIPVPRPKPRIHAPVSAPLTESGSTPYTHETVDPLEDIIEFLARQKRK